MMKVLAMRDARISNLLGLWARTDRRQFGRFRGTYAANCPIEIQATTGVAISDLIRPRNVDYMFTPLCKPQRSGLYSSRSCKAIADP